MMLKRDDSIIPVSYYTRFPKLARSGKGRLDYYPWMIVYAAILAGMTGYEALFRKKFKMVDGVKKTPGIVTEMARFTYTVIVMNAVFLLPLLYYYLRENSATRVGSASIINALMKVYPALLLLMLIIAFGYFRLRSRELRRQSVKMISVVKEYDVQSENSPDETSSDG